MRVARPFTVRLSSALLFGVAGLALLEAVVEVVFVTTDLNTYREAYTGEAGSTFASLTSFTLDLFFAAGVCILAFLTNQGRNNARVVTLVLGGLFLFCGGFGNLSDGLHQPSRSAGVGTLAEVMPAAYGIGIGIVDVLTILMTLGALVLLALPPSNRFFQTPYPGHFTAPQPGAFPAPQSGVLPAAQPAPYPHPAVGYGPRTPPPMPEQAPHTGSIPAIDPWADHEDRS